MKQLFMQCFLKNKKLSSKIYKCTRVKGRRVETTKFIL